MTESRVIWGWFFLGKSIICAVFFKQTSKSCTALWTCQMHTRIACRKCTLGCSMYKYHSSLVALVKACWYTCTCTCTHLLINRLVPGGNIVHVHVCMYMCLNFLVHTHEQGLATQNRGVHALSPLSQGAIARSV